MSGLRHNWIYRRRVLRSESDDTNASVKILFRARRLWFRQSAYLEWAEMEGG
jgi:hypothetical protein